MGVRVAITGGAGFLGVRLARRLLGSWQAIANSSAEWAGQELDELVLADLSAPPPDLLADPRVRAISVDLAAGNGPTPAGNGPALAEIGRVDAIFHLASVVSSAAEADFDLGMRTNLDGTRALLEYARGLAYPPVFVFSSSLAVFGSDPAVGPVGDVDDDTLPRPQSSYGIQKFIGEQLVADYTRKGFIRGRPVRLMTVAVRPGKPNAAASSFLSGMIREPISGQRAACPVPADTSIALSSPRRTVDGLLRAATVDEATWGSRTAMNLPALTTTPGEMAAALDRMVGVGSSDLIDWTDDPTVGDIVRSWPARFHTARAERLGLLPESSFDDIIRAYLDDLEPSAAR